MWHLTACKISVSLSFLNWIKNEMIFFFFFFFLRISELMLATLIERCDKNHFIFDPVQNRETRLLGATFYNCINTIYQFIKPFLDNEMSIFLGIRSL